MNQIEIIEFISFENFIKNINFHLNNFIEKGAVAYRNANISREQQFEILGLLGDKLNCSPTTNQIKNESYNTSYIENHKKLKEHRQDIDKDSIFLSWHVEHVYYKNPIVSAIWNMYNFKCDPTVGRTNFVDTTKLYKTLPQEWKNFLKHCAEKNYPQPYYDAAIENILDYVEYVKPHWVTKEPTLRINLSDKDKNINIKFTNNKEVTEKDMQLFKKIDKYCFDQIHNNKNIRMFHEWNQGDLVFVDIFRMAHAVSGGFNPKDREFEGTWSTLDKTNWQPTSV